MILSRTGGKVEIGRRRNANTVPNRSNGYFDSKVVSRIHAEVWCEDDKVCRFYIKSLITTDLNLPLSQVLIKDVKSTNGTFINGDRLSPESTESDIFQLHSNDTVVRCLVTPRSKPRD
jgi:pSer/pThr/pTyr-binding forkhead associated (FHA) protein